MAKVNHRYSDGRPKYFRASITRHARTKKLLTALKRAIRARTKISYVLISASLLAACTQTGHQATPDSVLSLSEPIVKITNTAVGHANLELAVDGTAKELFKQRDCILGKYAQENSATHILKPRETDVLFLSVDGKKKASLDIPFEYFISSQKIPDRAESRERLLANCSF